MLGGVPPALVIEVEKKAAELVDAAAAFYLDGIGYEGGTVKGGDAILLGGMFVYQLVPRHERGLQITAV